MTSKPTPPRDSYPVRIEAEWNAMSPRLTFRPEISRQVANTSSGPIFQESGNAALIPWASAISLLAELARRASYPEARVVSTWANQLGGIHAFAGHAYVQGAILGQLREASIWTQIGFAATLKGRIDATGDSEGLEGLSLSLANLLWMRAPEHIAVELATAASEMTKSSCHTLTWPYFVMEKSGAIASHPAGSYIEWDDETRRKMLERWHAVDPRLKELGSAGAAKLAHQLGKHSGNSFDPSRIGNPIGRPSLDEWLGKQGAWGAAAATDLNTNASSMAGYLATVSSHAPAVGPDTELDKYRSGTWEDEPFYRDDILTTSDMAGEGEEKDLAVTAAVGAAILAIGTALNKIAGTAATTTVVGEGGAEAIGPSLVVEGGAVVIAFGSGIVVGGALVYGIEHYAGGAVFQGMGWIREKVVEPITKLAYTHADSLGGGGGSKTPDPLGGDVSPGNVTPAILELAARNAKRLGLWRHQLPSDQNDTNRPELTPMDEDQFEFRFDDPLRDPVDTLIVDGNDPNMPPKQIDSTLFWRRFIYYSGPGTATGLKSVGTGKVLCTDL